MSAAPELPAAGSAELELDGRRIRLSSLDKVLWPGSGFTKRDMLGYYAGIAPALLPHIRGRPLTLGRFPDGIDGAGFAQTECRGRPDWLRTHPIRLRSGRVRHYCVLDDLPSLMWAVNLGAIELHAFLAASAHEEEATAVAFDLDPGPGVGLADCCRVALALRRALAADGLESFPKASGSLGLHVYVPLNVPYRFKDTRAFAGAVAARLAAATPERVTDRRRGPRRAGTVLVDWQQNQPRSLMAVPYSLRATDVPAVSAPVRWEEVERAAVTGRLPFAPGAVLERWRESGDLFQPVLELTQRLPEPFPRLVSE